jgi:MFS family permease
MAFGLSKAIANYFTGKWAQHLGRKKLLLLGWTIALPIPFMLIYTTSWNVVLLANILLGISQGLTWSSTVIMKIDLVGEKNRGLAMGLNEFAGYAAVGIMAWISGWVAFEWGIVPYPFYLGILISVAGWLLTWLWVKDTVAFVKKESQLSKIGVLKNPFSSVTWRHRPLSAVNQAGWVNNLNDGMMWGLFPILLFDLNYNLQEIGFLAAAYPTAWGVGQLFTGKMADHISTKKMLVGGMSLQGIAIIALTMVDEFAPILSCAILLGVGTALVYPTFITVIAQHSHPQQRAETVGIFRLWRDLGYVFGALISGAIADHWGIMPAIFFIGVITLISGWVVQLRMNN